MLRLSRLQAFALAALVAGCHARGGPAPGADPGDASLPADHPDEVIVSIRASRSDCQGTPNGAGILIDDLRAE